MQLLAYAFGERIRDRRMREIRTSGGMRGEATAARQRSLLYSTVFRSSLRSGPSVFSVQSVVQNPGVRDGELNHDDTTNTTRGGEEETQPIPGHPGLTWCPVPASCASRGRGSIPLPAAGRKKSWPRMPMGGHALRRRGKKMAKKRWSKTGSRSSI